MVPFASLVTLLQIFMQQTSTGSPLAGVLSGRSTRTWPVVNRRNQVLSQSNQGVKICVSLSNLLIPEVLRHVYGGMNSEYERRIFFLKTMLAISDKEGG